MIVWIASYPKSGNTWIRSLLSTYLYLEDNNFNFEILYKIPNFTQDKYFSPLIDLNTLKDKPLKISEYWIAAQSRINLEEKNKLFKTHSACISYKNKWFTDNINTSGYIHVVRDPRSVVCSKAVHSNLTIEECVNNLLNDDFVGYNGKYNLAELTSSWKINYLSWKKKKKFPGILIKYEDLIDDTEKELRRILEFLKDKIKVNLDEKKVKKTVEICSFSKLKNLENKKGFIEAVNGRFFRKGKKDNWKIELDSASKKKIEEKLKKEMSELEYI